jgi:hypothetical protein
MSTQNVLVDVKLYERLRATIASLEAENAELRAFAIEYAKWRELQNGAGYTHEKESKQWRIVRSAFNDIQPIIEKAMQE